MHVNSVGKPTLPLQHHQKKQGYNSADFQPVADHLIRIIHPPETVKISGGCIFCEDKGKNQRLLN